MKNKRLIYLIVLFNLFLFSINNFAEEKITLTTFYPSPHGSYRKIDFNGEDSTAVETHLEFFRGNQSSFRFQTTGNGGGDAWKFIINQTAFGDIFVFTMDGRLGIRTDPHSNYLLDVNGGDVRVGGNVLANNVSIPSDLQFKKNIVPIPSALEKIQKIKGVYFKWKDITKDEDIHVGVIAQDVEKVFPELVVADSEGMKAVAYANLVAPLIEAVKEQQTQIKELQQEIEKLKKKTEVLDYY